MTIRFARFARTALALSLGLSSALAFAQQPIVIKFSHVTAVDSPKGKAADFFKQLAEKNTNGRVKVEVYPNSSLYKDKEELEALQIGAIQMLAPSLSKFGPLGAKEFELFELPYLFSDYDQLHKITFGPVGAQLFRKLEPKGILGLAYWDNGFRQMSSNKPLRVPADFKGLKLRIVSAKITDAYTRALGATPQVMAFSEVYQAMQTGVVDGGENALSNMATQKFYEVQKYITLSDHGYLGYAVVVNKKFWEGLPPDIRKILTEAMAKATEFNNQTAKADNDASLEFIKKTGKTQIITLTPAEKAEWKKAVMPVHKQMEDRIGKELLQSAYKDIGFTGK
jgi:C4-dicarboxylate-binding protein DctP